MLEGFTCQGEDLVLERQLGAGKNASGSFSLRRWTWKRNSVAGDSSWTQGHRGPGRGRSCHRACTARDWGVVDKRM